MDIDEGQAGSEVAVVAEAASGSASIYLHPLVIINISEHATRLRVQNGGREVAAYGALLGEHEGQRIEIFNSFAMVVTDNTIDMDFLNRKCESFKRVFKKLELVGWYATGQGSVSGVHQSIHQQMMLLNESPLFLLLSTVPSPSATDLPISIFESVIEIVHEQQVVKFVRNSYTMASEEAERIGVEHIAQVSQSSATSSEVTTQNLGMQSALKMLLSRVLIIHDFLVAVKKGQVQCSHSLLRQLRSLCSRLPVSADSALVDGMRHELSDAQLTALLAEITRGCSIIAQMSDRFNIVEQNHGGRRGRAI